LRPGGSFFPWTLARPPGHLQSLVHPTLRAPPCTVCKSRTGWANRNCMCRDQYSRCPLGKCPWLCDRSSRDRSYRHKWRGDRGDCKRPDSCTHKTGWSAWANRNRRVRSPHQYDNCFPCGTSSPRYSRTTRDTRRAGWQGSPSRRNIHRSRIAPRSSGAWRLDNVHSCPPRSRRPGRTGLQGPVRMCSRRLTRGRVVVGRRHPLGDDGWECAVARRLHRRPERRPRKTRHLRPWRRPSAIGQRSH
jgi:hypothetical protein